MKSQVDDIQIKLSCKFLALFHECACFALLGLLVDIFKPQKRGLCVTGTKTRIPPSITSTPIDFTSQ
jgi:hypothetical protein